ncbi:MAG: lipoyl domain-containing protein [Leptospiraceae bacterium]|nr:lipoyl domain-containing protein [Leptospiraceae bacterium]MDW8305990.1 lipoyl domain-containing protein [Leptospiraceae bacterium]
MRLELKVPDIGDADRIELLRWKVRPGESFAEGEELCELLTDKAAFSLEAPRAGKLLEILVEDGQEVRVGQLVAYAEVD